MNDLNKEDNISRINWFLSDVFDKKIKPQKIKENKNEKIMKELKDISTCYMCLDYLDDPVWDPLCCCHYACKKCFYSYFNKMKCNIIQCPICRRKIRKSNLKEIPLVQHIKDILKETKNLDIYGEEKIDEKCSTHPKNKVFYICLDCSKKMCPVCDIEKGNHETHHIVNYERYVQLFYCFRNNFTQIKEKIKKIENNIKEYNNLYTLLEQQKKSYLNLLNNISKKVEDIYSTKIDNLQKLISNSFDDITELKKFMNDLKKDVSSRFKISYNDIEIFEEIEKEIKEKVNDINLKFSKTEVPNMENLNLKDLVASKIEFPLTIKSDIFNNKRVFSKKLDSQGIYTFGAELYEDNKFILCYLDIENRINNIKNESTYSPYIEYGEDKKQIYLEENKFDDKHYSYEILIPLQEFLPGKEDTRDIKININYISIV